MGSTRKTAVAASRRSKSSAGVASNGRHRRGPSDAETGSLESGVRKLAAQGKLAKAAGAAIRAQRKRGVPVTFQRGDQVVKQYSDGRIEVLQKLKRRAPYSPPRGVKVIGRS